MQFLVLAVVLAIGAAYVAPMVSGAVASAAPSIGSNKMLALLVTGVALAATVWIAHEILPREVRE